MHGETRRSYDAVAGRYTEEVGDEMRGKPLDRALIAAFAELTGDGPVLDAGCGPGHVAAHLAGLGVQVIGLDLSPAMCAIAATSVPSACGDLTALPFGACSLAGVLSFYSVIHLDDADRRAAYGELARVLRPGGLALIAFHTSDADVPTGGSLERREWWGQQVELTFRFLDPGVETAMLADAGLELVARTDRAPNPAVEHPSQRTVLLLRSPSIG